MGKTAIAVKKARAARAGPGKAVEDIMGIMSIRAMILAKMRRKICPSAKSRSMFIYYPVTLGIIPKRLMVKLAMEFIIHDPKRPIIAKIATILGTNVRVWS